MSRSASSWFVCWTHIIVNTILRLITKSKGPLQHHTSPRLLISRRFSSRLSVADARSSSMLWACCSLCMKPSTHRFIYVSWWFAVLFDSVAVLSTKGAFLKAEADVHVEAPSCLNVFAQALTFISSCQIFFFFIFDIQLVKSISWRMPFIGMKRDYNNSTLISFPLHQQPVLSPERVRYRSVSSVTSWSSSLRCSFVSLFLEDAPLRSFVTSHIPRFFVRPKMKKERKKERQKFLLTSCAVDRHFHGPGRQKWWREGKTSGEATRKCSKGSTVTFNNGWRG